MIVRYAKDYLDRLYDTKNVFALYSVISVVSRQRSLPEQFWLFLRLWDWCCSTRSGIWQYYEAVPAAEFEFMVGALERFGLRELAERYQAGMTAWRRPEGCGELDLWIDGHWDELEATAFRLILDSRGSLYDES